MGTILAFAVGTLIALAVIAFLPAFSGGQRGAGAPAPAAAAAPAWLTRKTVGAAALAVAITALLVWIFSDKFPSGTGSFIWTMLFVALGIVLILKAGKAGKWIGIPIIVLGLIFGARAPEALIKGQEKVSGVVLDDKPIFSNPPASTPAVPPVPVPVVETIDEEKAAIWDRLEADGTIPVDVWSEMITKSKKCKGSFALPDGVEAKSAYNSNDLQPWVRGQKRHWNKLQFKVTKKGISKVEYTLHCKK